MRIRKLLKMIMKPIDKIEIYDGDRNLIYSVNDGDFEKSGVLDEKIDLFDIYEKEDIIILEVMAK